MICQRCRTTLLSRLHFQQYAIRSPSSACLLTGQQNTRLYSSDTPNIHAMPPPPAPRQQGSSSVSVPSAISSATPGVSQPLSTPTQAAHVDIKPSADASKSAKPAVEREPSSCVAGTKLNGLNYMKNKPGVFALEDSEYPDWLWGLLDSSKTQTKTELGGVDPSSQSPFLRRKDSYGGC
jgi:large subunit ribosomal protein L54